MIEVAPDNAGLVADVTVAAADMDNIHVGQHATLRFFTFNPHGKTAIPGTVTRLSPDRVGEAGVYRARIRLDDPAAPRRDKLVLRVSPTCARAGDPTVPPKRSWADHHQH